MTLNFPVLNPEYVIRSGAIKQQADLLLLIPNFE